MKSLIAVVMGLLICVSAFGENWSITPYGYGPVKVGMTVEQAAKILETNLIADEGGPNSECYHVYPERGHKGLAFMIENYKVTRASIYGPPSSIKTDRGIKIGDSEKKILRAYGNHLDVSSHHYGDYPDDKYFTYWIKGRRFGVRYETKQGIVDTIHGGSTAIQFVEGCS